jgi:hypothetical protein
MALRIAETATATWHYHLHEDGGEPKMGGGCLKMLCGETLTAWDTSIPVESWGKKSDHIPEHFCEGCTEVLKQILGGGK